MLRTTLLITVCLFAPALTAAQTQSKSPARAETPAGAAAGQTGSELLRRFAEGDEGAFIDGVRAAGARVDYGWSPLCLLGELERGKFVKGLVAKAEDEKRKEALTRAAREWAAQTSNERREVTRLLVAAGATCADAEDEEPEVEEAKP